jgi:hypothetical protein
MLVIFFTALMILSYIIAHIFNLNILNLFGVFCGLISLICMFVQSEES